MPSLPIFRHRVGMEGAVEVSGEAKPQNLCRSDSDVRIAREIAEDLKGKTQGRERDQCPRTQIETGVDCIDYVSQPVCYDVFLIKSPSYQLKSGDRVGGAERMHFPELRNQILGTFDRSGRELREEQDINGKHRE